MSHRHVIVCCIIALAISVPAAAQGDDAPFTIPALDEEIIQIVDGGPVKDIPDVLVAKLDDREIKLSHLMEQLLRTSLNEVANTLLSTKMVELEMKRQGITVTEEDVMAEITDLLPRIAPGQTLEQVLESGVYSRDYLIRNARANRGWKMLFWKSRNIKPENRADEANKFLMQLYRNEVQARYQMAVRGQNPGPPPGTVASLNTLISGKRVSYVVSKSEAMEFLVGAVKPVHILRAYDQMLDHELVEGAMQNAAVVVAAAEVEAWARSMIVKYPPPFTWETILRLKGTTPDQERQRWRQVQAWKRVQKIKIDDKDVQAFRAEHEDFFRQRHVKVSHILCKFVDDITGLSKGEAAEKAAYQKAMRIRNLAREGVDFKVLAGNYSEDAVSAKSGGAMPQPIKKWGGGYDENFQKVAYMMKKGELSKPVKSVFGYHIIYCNEEKAPSEKAIDWSDPNYGDWLLEEYETRKMIEWVDSIRESTRIERVPTETILAVKDIRFGEK